MKILLISHTCQSRTEGQPKAHALARLDDIQLHLLIPDRWMNYAAWRRAEIPLDPQFAYTIAKVRWPWVGPAQFYLHYYPRLKKILREFQPDIIDLWEEPWGLVSAHACHLRNRYLPHCKIIAETEQNTDKKLPFPFEHFRRYTLRNAAFAVGRNQEALDIIRRKGYTGPARVVPNAVDADLFHPMDRAACRAALGFPPSTSMPEPLSASVPSSPPSSNAFIAGYVGRIIEQKGLMELVNALPHCPPQVSAVIVGSGSKEEDFTPPLLARAAELKLGDRFRILPAVPLEKLPPLMNALDVLVLPSRTVPRWKEQFGRVIIEANACQTPAIGSTSGAIPEVIGDVGLTFEERNPQALAAAITQLYNNPIQTHELGQRARLRVEQKFTWQKVAEQMRDIYLETLSLPAVPKNGSVFTEATSAQ